MSNDPDKSGGPGKNGPVRTAADGATSGASPATSDPGPAASDTRRATLNLRAAPSDSDPTTADTGPATSVAGIPAGAIRFSFVRASGPGGQNVNKVASAVQLRLDLPRSGLPRAVRERLARLAGGQINQRDELIIFAQRFRSQVRNREDALERLAALVARAREVPKRRVPTAPSRAEKRRRQQAKQERAALKKNRARPAPDD